MINKNITRYFCDILFLFEFYSLLKGHILITGLSSYRNVAFIISNCFCTVDVIPIFIRDCDSHFTKARRKFLSVSLYKVIWSLSVLLYLLKLSNLLQAYSE